jgi:hypothetical protein
MTLRLDLRHILRRAPKLHKAAPAGAIHFPVRNDDGSNSGFVGFADGQLKMPPQWLRTNVETETGIKKPRIFAGLFLTCSCRSPHRLGPALIRLERRWDPHLTDFELYLGRAL